MNPTKDLHEAITALKAERNITYIEASLELSETRPELFEAYDAQFKEGPGESGLERFNELVEDLAARKGLTYSQAYKKIEDIMAQKLSDVGQTVVLADTVNNPTTLALVASQRINAELFEGKRLSDLVNVFLDDNYLRDALLSWQGVADWDER